MAGIRGYSDHEIDEAVLVSQRRRADERMADPSWQLVPDEWTAALGGGTWQQTKQEQSTVKTITFEQFIGPRMARHTAEEAERNAPAAVACRALETLSSALDEIGPGAERNEILREMRAVLCGAMLEPKAATATMCQFCHESIEADDPPMGGSSAHAVCFRRASATAQSRRAAAYRQANGIPDAGRI